MQKSEFIQLLKKTQQAAQMLATLSTAKKNAVLTTLVRELARNEKTILSANKKDCARVPNNYPHTDRLTLTHDRLRDIIAGVHAVATLPDPVGTTIDKRVLANGINLRRERVPLGVVGVIYEARPNVTIDIASLVLKSGNAVVLKGGSDAFFSNHALVACIHRAFRKNKIPEAAVLLLDARDRKQVDWLFTAHGLVDVLIPRGGNALIQYVRAHARIPVIETGAGVCHVYIEKSANIAMAANIIHNAKTRRPSVCNALDTIVVDRALLAKLSAITTSLAQDGVRVLADAPAYTALARTYPSRLLKKARASDFGKEFLSLTCSIKTVRNFPEAVAFVQSHTSHHSEGIITNDKKKATEYLATIDAAAVYHNASIAFTDGFEFGLGAEIGISTQKLHARGPMGLVALTSYKWIAEGRGQVRKKG
ncbi:glutamate-5-semialdehyde dehydrogenase [Candidatus Uhrbacteria bacterium]|nr:glutamate-5-semialdehyde dehydrogenase [Candidatus Uhrbacteria bacterium]